MGTLQFGGMTTSVQTVDGLAVRYASTQGRGGAPVVLLSPWPESLFAFAPIWRLSEQFDLIAIDLPGFGHSESRQDLFTPEGMATFVLRLIHEWDLGQVHAVGPDIGTSVLLTASLNSPDTLLSITVGSGAVSYPLEVSGTLKDIIDAPDLGVFAAMPARDLVGAALTGIERYQLPDEIREDYLSSYDGPRFAQSTQYVRSYPETLKCLQPRLASATTPTLIIAGRKDPFVPPSNAEYLHQHLPHSKLAIVDTGHFTWEDAEEYGQLISDWISEGHQSGFSPR